MTVYPGSHLPSRRNLCKQGVHIGLALAVVLLALGCASAPITRYRSPAWSGYSDRIAVLPLVLASAPDTRDAGSYSPKWIIRTGAGDPLPEAAYKQAEQAVVQSVTRAMPGRTIIPPSKVENAMRGKDPAPLKPAMAAGLSARRTGSHAGLVFSVLDFSTHDKGAAPGEATGTTQVALYGTAGKVVWTLNAKLTMQGDGDEPPTLEAFVAYAATAFEDAIEDAMEGLDPDEP